MRIIAARFAKSLVFASLGVTAMAPVGAAGPISAGEAIYRDGILPNSAPVVGERPRLASLKGAAAACVRCHRRSGLGAAEGELAIPPITSPYLAQSRDQNTLQKEFKIAPGYHVSRPAFTDVTLARAIRSGVVPGGGELNALMPRYPLDDAAMASLIAYVKSLSRRPAPGVTADTLHFATIVTPDADPRAMKAMLDVLEHYVADPIPIVGAPRKMLHPNRMVGFRTGQLKWALHVWRLEGHPDTWQRQLRERLRAQPVFAVVAGLGGRDWTPIHRFCEREALPCLMPNVDLPVAADGDFYSIYFSRGVLLEADLAARWLMQQRDGREPQRVVQVYRSDDIGAAAAQEAQRQLAALGFRVEDRKLAPGATSSDWARAIDDAGRDDALLLWARAADLASLPRELPSAGTVLVSGLMGGLQAAPLSQAWRGIARMTFPQDLPERSAKRLEIARGWLARQGIALVDERVQIDTYATCVALSDIVGSLYGTYSRELLVERFEDMLGRSAPAARYPRLGLAQGQRFASKGGFIVHFARPDGDTVVADGDWIVP